MGHAIGRKGLAQAGLPGTELADQVVARQAQQAGHGGIDAGQGRAVAGGAGGQFARRIAAADQRLTAREFVSLCFRGLGWRVRQIQPGEVARDVAQVGVAQVVEQIAHAGVVAPTVAKVQQLVVQVIRRFAGDAREVAGVGGAAFLAMAQGAGHHALGQGVGHGVQRLGSEGGTEKKQCREDDGNGGSKVGHGRFESTTGTGPIH